MTVLGGRSVDPIADVPGSARQRLLGKLSPSLRDGLALVLSNGLSSAVGLGYWVLAARLFSPAAVGVNNVALSTMMLPSIVGEGEACGSYYVLESRLPGSGGLDALTDPARRRTYRSSAIATVFELHRATTELRRIGEDELRRSVHEPMAIVTSALPRAHRGAALALEAALVERLRGALVATAWAHGDYTADNLLSDDDGRIVAVVDWCDGDPAGLAVLDVVSFLLTTDVATGGAELGAVVLDRLADAPKPGGDLLVRVQRNLGGDVLGADLLTLLAWLQHVSHNLAKSPSYAANPVWVRRNLVPVVRDAQLS